MKSSIFITFSLHWDFNGNDQIRIDICNPPENLDNLIHEAFRSYTYGTSPDYTDDDKLAFIDNFRKKLNPANFDDYHDQYAHHLLDRAIEDGGSFDLNDDVDSSVDFAMSCYDEGFKPLYIHDESVDSHKIAAAHKTICRIIADVMAYKSD
ncbi:MAG: hypothetical protein LKE64_12155 [Solobacterium sp.]|jgi:hypothetical protein|nr:hypothetical protein [Solobacterium sp.]MCH4048010.1 hypothetical protein [Solobacterium sp.]MCH4075404.1 hypothetical protein [Solobacterium sp.]MCI1313746.1 hypothetical protein [Solobacterium sp.]MCI1407143.1 hypothetical protein [Solobacterium sp.]